MRKPRKHVVNKLGAGLFRNSKCQGIIVSIIPLYMSIIIPTGGTEINGVQLVSHIMGW